MHRLALPVALLLPLLGGCSDSTGPGGTGTVVLRLDNVVSGEPLALNTGTYTNAAGNAYTVSKLEYTVSDFELVGPGGTASHADPYYRDASDPGTRDLVLVDVPAGQYRTLRFRHGIPADMNQAGAFPALDNAGMAWPAAMGGGYHYMRHEGAYTPTGGGVANFTTHTGPSMGMDFSVPVDLTLPSIVNVADGETVTLELEMDVNAWYDGTMYDFNDYGMIMGDPAAQTLLQGNGDDVWSVGSIQE
jgi:hypothetical protein